jgi:iron(III) transport system permease protein
MVLRRAAPQPASLPRRRPPGLGAAAMLLAGLCLFPVAAVVLAALTGGTDTARHLAATRLPVFAGNTALLVLLVAAGTAAVGTATAWLVTMTRFPGARWFEYLLPLPLAFPAYVLAYAYTTFLDHPGPVQRALRELTGWGPADYWFPDVRSLPGAALMLIFVLYPYVYLLARALFLSQSGSAWQAARALGQGPWAAFWRVSLPMAWPAVAGGTLLAVMETIADIATVFHFGVPTLATGIYQAWFSMGDRAAAAQLALVLLAFALALALAERGLRGQAQFSGAGRRFERLPPMPLGGARAAAALAVCALPVTLGFLLPVVILFEMAIGSGQNLLSERYARLIANSLTLAGAAAVLTVGAAAVLRFNARLHPGRAARGAVEAVRLGYAVPGGVIALGLLVPVAGFDNALDAVMRAAFGISTGLLLSGGIGLLLVAYYVRFAAVAMNALDSGLSAIPPQMHLVGRTLGSGPAGVIGRILLPLSGPSVLTAALIVFVDVMKELPATLIMRPFDFDTLAIQAFRLAADERLDGAAVPSLVIVAFGLLPVLLLMREVGRGPLRAR